MEKPNRFTVKRVSLAMTGIFLVCIGVAFNNNTNLGNDPVGIIYDGIRQTFGVAQINLGKVGRHYANVGSLMYLIPYGFFVLLGSHLYVLLFPHNTIPARVAGGIIGISLYYIGISLFICADIGVDPFSGFMLTIRDHMHWSVRRTKISFDLILIIVGILLGGKFGVITIVALLTTGPAIQFLSDKFSRWFKVK